MRAEFLKLRSLPTPLWTAVALAVCFLLGLVACIVWHVGEDNDALGAAIALPLNLASLVIGSWIVGVEFGQHTLRRVLSADPRRTRLILVKLAVLLIVVVGATVLLMALGTALYGLASSGKEFTVDYDAIPKLTAAMIVSNASWGIAAFSLTLLTRSMAGGITLSFAFLLVIDGLTSLLPTVGDYTLGVALADVDLAIRGSDGGEGLFEATQTNDTLVSVLVLAGWLIVFLAAGIVRTNESEVK